MPSNSPASNASTSAAALLVLNAGSSSIKFAVFDATPAVPERAPMWSGKVEGIGSAQVSYHETPEASDQPETSDTSDTGHAPKAHSLDRSLASPKHSHKDSPEAAPTLKSGSSYHDALEYIRRRVERRLHARPIAGVAHRVVHGGDKYQAPTRITRQVLKELRAYVPLAPLHQPFALDAIDIFLESRPDLPQIACFDTAFHNTMPDVEKALPLPPLTSTTAHSAETVGIDTPSLRRYGFHGLSYEYQTHILPERYGERAKGRVIAAHLGSGASLCGMHHLQSVTTTMGFSALDGLMMGTRCGSLDPGALIYLMEVQKLSLEAVGDMLYHKAGLLGVSGLSADPRVLLQHEAENARAADALALYCRSFLHAIGACSAALGGLEMIVFTAGIGENNAEMRARLCAPLAYMGVMIDAQANHDETHPARIISHPNSRVLVVVEPTNEEWVAARHARTLLDR